MKTVPEMIIEGAANDNDLPLTEEDIDWILAEIRKGLSGLYECTLSECVEFPRPDCHQLPQARPNRAGEHTHPSGEGEEWGNEEEGEELWMEKQRKERPTP